MAQTAFDLDRGRAERDDGIALVEEAHPTDVQRIRRWITEFAAMGRRFTADDVRANLSVEVASAAFGTAFMHASRSGEIVEVGYTQSRYGDNHARAIPIWIGASHADAFDALPEYTHTPPTEEPA